MLQLKNKTLLVLHFINFILRKEDTTKITIIYIFFIDMCHKNWFFRHFKTLVQKDLGSNPTKVILFLFFSFIYDFIYNINYK